jgi:cysteinyl-tRNA synthetase
MVDGAKMSKSLGNLYTLKDLQSKGFSPAVLRYSLIGSSYRQQLNFTLDGLHAARSALLKMERFADSLLEVTGEERTQLDAYIHPKTQNGFGRFSKAWESLCNNLNTAASLGAVFGVIGSNPAPSLKPEEARDLLDAYGSILYALGLQLFTIEAPTQEAPAEILALAEQRWEAKQAKNWAKADELRNEILAAGWIVKDGKDGFEVVLS